MPGYKASETGSPGCILSAGPPKHLSWKYRETSGPHRQTAAACASRRRGRASLAGSERMSAVRPRRWPGSSLTRSRGSVTAAGKFWERYIKICFFWIYHLKLKTQHVNSVFFLLFPGRVCKVLRDDRPLHQQSLRSQNHPARTRLQTAPKGEGKPDSLFLSLSLSLCVH